MKNKRLWTYAIPHKAALISYVIAVFLYVVYQFNPRISEAVGWGVLMIVPSMLVFAVAPSAVALALSAAIAIIYWLGGIRQNIIAASLGFSISFAVISLLIVVVELPLIFKIIGSIVLAFIVFIGSAWAANRLTISRNASIIVGGILIILSVYSAPYISHPFIVQRATVIANDAFAKAVEKLAFAPYYPTYTSSVYPASPPELNGYANDRYSNETVTFLLGNGQVKQSAYIKGQDKVMNFVDNCSFYRLWFSVEDTLSVAERDVSKGVENPQACKVVHVTPTGKNVYVDDNDSQWTRFYVQLDNLNFMIEFDNINGRKYDPNQRDELLRVIDSLQPLATSKLQDGNSNGGGFNY